jgi:hypothetical protein
MRSSIVLTLLVATAVVAGCHGPMQHNLPPAQRMMEPGPGVGGPGPGVLSFGNPAPPSPGATSQVSFVGPEGMVVNWDVAMPGHFDSEPLIAPGRQNFPIGAIYRLKLTNIPGRAGVELYPTLEIAPPLPRTEAYLAHNAIPVQWTEEDFNQVLAGNFVTKVIYLPDPEYQELALAGVETLVSTRLDPGVDPIVEADRRGAILAIARLGNKDLEVPGEMLEEGDVMQAQYVEGDAGMFCPEDQGQPIGAPNMPRPMARGAAAPAAVPPGPVSGMTVPQYGMPMSGTPIGLPGPPHVPHGVPAGLQKHVVKNHTRMHLPGPTEKLKVHVKQKPGFSYPKPPSTVRIIEKTFAGFGLFRRPKADRRHRITPAGGPCPSGTPTAPCPTDMGM